MIRKSTALLGAGVVVAALAAPLAATAHADDNALAFVIGAAVGKALDDDHRHVRRVHGRKVGHVYRGHAPKVRYRGHRKVHGWHAWDRKWHHGHRRHDNERRFGDHRERRHDRDRHDRDDRDHRRDRGRHHG